MTVAETRFDAERAFLLALYEKAVAMAHPHVCVPPHLPKVPDAGRLLVIGAGKAGAAMAQAAERHYARLPGFERVSGFVVTRHGFALPTDHLRLIEAGHPVPDDNSIEGAKAALQAVSEAKPGDVILCLLSGGASALWSAPAKGISFAQKQALTKALLRSGARISEMNCVRKHLSAIKGGRLAAAAAKAGAQIITLAISDVPGDEPDAIGSGPTVGDKTTLADARDILARYNVEVPEAIASALNDPANETPDPDSDVFEKADYRIIAAPKASLEAAGELVKAEGFTPVFLGDSLEGEAREIARVHAELALEARQRGEQVAILSGGELTVTIRGEGRGGPNQEYALALAAALDGAEGICAIAGDTDGTDGGKGAADDPAGAFVFPDTVARARQGNLNPVTFLENNDSTGFFAALGDLISCGPTQTNVNDFRAILVKP